MPRSAPDAAPSAVSRRRFVRTTAAALAAAPLLSAVPGRRRGFKKAVKLSMVKTPGSLHDKLALLAELGFDGVEPASPSALDPRELVAASAATGVRLHGVIDSDHWRHPFSHPDEAVRAKAVAALKTALHDAKTYGASTVLVVPAVVQKDVGYAEAYRTSQAELRKVLPVAAELGVQIAFENVWNNFLLSPLEFARYVDEFESPWVGAYFDIGNVVKFGWPEHWIRVLGKRILKVDVKGYSQSKGFGVPIGEGDIDWPAVRKELAAIGYAGWATAEVSGGGREELADIAARMDRVLAG